MNSLNQGIYLEIFNRKSIPRNTTHRQSYDLIHTSCYFFFCLHCPSVASFPVENCSDLIWICCEVAALWKHNFWAHGRPQLINIYPWRVERFEIDVYVMVLKTVTWSSMCFDATGKPDVVRVYAAIGVRCVIYTRIMFATQAFTLFVLRVFASSAKSSTSKKRFAFERPPRCPRHLALFPKPMFTDAQLLSVIFFTSGTGQHLLQHQIMVYYVLVSECVRVLECSSVIRWPAPVRFRLTPFQDSCVSGNLVTCTS